MKRIAIPLLMAWVGVGAHPSHATPFAAEISERQAGPWLTSTVADAPMAWAGQRMPATQNGSELRNGIAMTDDIAMVGDLRGVHVYRKQAGQWIETQLLEPSQVVPDEYYFAFGPAIAIRATRAVIGHAQGNNGIDRVPPESLRGSEPSPAAYVFEEQNDVWIETARLTPDDGAPGNWGQRGNSFATSLAVDGVTVAVGAYSHTPDPDRANQGAVYVFNDNGSGWAQTQKLMPDDGRAGDQFGSAIAIQGDTMLIGARGATRNRDFPWHGLIYVFERQDGLWVQRQKIYPSPMVVAARFGHALGMDGDSAIVGAPRGLSGYVEYGETLGGVFMLQRTNGFWSVAQSLPSLNDEYYGDSLGDSVAISGDLAIAGAYQTFYTLGMVQQGVAYAYERIDGRWAKRSRITSPEGMDYGFFGAWVGLSGRSAIIGTFSPGNVFSFEASKPPAAHLVPLGVNPVVSPNGVAQGSLRIENAGEASLQFALDAPPSTRPLALHARSEHSTDNLGRAAISGDEEIAFALDDGGYEVKQSFNFRFTEQAAVWLNRFAAPSGTGAFTIDSISMMIPSENAGKLIGKAITLVAYYDADSDGNPGNAVRLGTDHPATITAEGQFLTFPTDFRVPGDGDVYVGFETTYARGGIAERWPVALDTSNPVLERSWVASMEDGAPNLDDLSANRVQMYVEDYTREVLAGNAMIRATGKQLTNDCVDPNAIPWLTYSETAGSVPAAGSVTINLQFDGSGLSAGTHSAQICVASNDPARAMQRVPVSLTVVTEGAIFRDGFEVVP